MNFHFTYHAVAFERDGYAVIEDFFLVLVGSANSLAWLCNFIYQQKHSTATAQALA